MACKTEQENIELREERNELLNKVAFLTNKIYEILSEKKNGTGTNKQNSISDPVDP